MTSLPKCLAAAALALAAHAVVANDSDSLPTDKLAPVRERIAARQWDGAIRELQRINDPSSADWNNLMGYSLRKSPAPDLEAAERHYEAALRIEPRHRGALEYSGELALMKGDLAKAEERLATLDRACRLPCGEYRDLKKAIAAYKANGNKYASKD